MLPCHHLRQRSRARIRLVLELHFAPSNLLSSEVCSVRQLLSLWCRLDVCLFFFESGWLCTPFCSSTTYMPSFTASLIVLKQPWPQEGQHEFCQLMCGSAVCRHSQTTKCSGSHGRRRSNLASPGQNCQLLDR